MSVVAHKHAASQGLIKVLVVVLASALLSLGLAAPAHQALAGEGTSTAVVDGVSWEYRLDADNAVIVGCTHAEGGIDIPRTLDGHPVVELAQGIFQNNTRLTAVSFPPTVRALGKNLFYGCTELTSATLAPMEELAAIPENCFLACPKLASVTIPASVTSIEASAFEGCSGLQELGLPTSGNLKSIELAAFKSCTALEEVDFPLELATIGDGAFFGCTSLKSILFRGTKATSIKRLAFKDCTALSEVTMPENLASLGEKAFGGCSNLKRVFYAKTMPSSVGSQVFEGCPLELMAFPCAYNSSSSSPYSDQSLFARTSAGWSPRVAWVSIMYNPADTGNGDVRIYSIHATEQNGAVSLPSAIGQHEITLIVNNAAQNQTNLTQLAFSEGCKITEIDDHAFRGCTKLQAIQIPASVTRLGLAAFRGCSSLSELSFEQPSSMRNFGGFTFADCPRLTGISFPEGMTQVVTHDFFNCTGLIEIVFPNTMKTVGEEAFSHDSTHSGMSVSRVYMPNSKETLVLPQDTAFWMPWVRDPSKLNFGFKFYVTYGSYADVHYLDKRIKPNPSHLSEFPESIREYVPVSLEEKEGAGSNQNYTVELSWNANVPYNNGKPALPTVTATRWHRNTPVGGDNLLVEPAEGDDCSSVGAHRAKVTGKAPYFSGEREIEYQIDGINMSEVYMREITPACVWDDKPWTPKPSFYTKLSDGTYYDLVEGTDYTIEGYKNNTLPLSSGQAELLIQGMGAFEGVRTFNFVINPATLSAQSTRATVESQTFTGQELRPIPTKLMLADRSGSYNVQLNHGANKDYVVTSYSNNIHTGKGKMKLEPAQDCAWLTGSLELEFDILPAHIEDARVNAIPDQVFTGKEICPDLTLTLGEYKLVKGKDYELEWKNNINAGTAEVFVWAKGASFTGDPKIVRFNITRKPAIVRANNANKVFGSPGPALSAQVEGLVGEDSVSYSLEREGGEDVGTYAIEVTGATQQGNYSLSFVGATFTIEQEDIVNTLIDPIEDQLYTGSAIEPNVRVYIEGVDLLLLRDKDFTLSYEDNIEPGMAIPGGFTRARVIITGIGNLKGVRTTSFRIVRPVSYSVKKAPTTVKQGTGIAPEFIFSRSFDDDTTLSHFSGALLDGVELQESEYKLRSGSLIFTLNATKIDALKPGSHTLTIRFNDGVAEAAFTVKEADPDPGPGPGPGPGPNPPNPDPDPADPNDPKNPGDNGGKDNKDASKSQSIPRTADEPRAPFAALLTAGLCALAAGASLRQKLS